ncbi:hypothetical protein PI124_g9528 [Phytophthora idaei]|nr:hypothetical protein PI124_g9528 [Phytophthora idaei]
MPHVGASRGAKAHAKSAATKQQTKSSKPRGKGSALQEATEVASKAVTSSGDAPADTGASSRRSRSPSLPKDDGPNPRFAVREYSPGTVAEARAKHDGSHSEEAAGERTPLPSEGGRESVHSLGSDHGGHSPMSPADEAMDSSNARVDEDDKPRRVLRNLSISEGRERAQAAKATAEQSKHTKKRHASRSPRREALGTEVDPYKDLFASDSDEEEGEGAVNEPQEISNDLDRQQEDFQASQRVRGRPTTGSHSPGHDGSPARDGGAPHPRGYWPPEPSSGAELYLEQLVAPRGLIWRAHFRAHLGAAEPAVHGEHRGCQVRASSTAPNSSQGIHDSAQEVRESGWPPSRLGLPLGLPRELPVVGRRRLAVLEVGSFS